MIGIETQVAASGVETLSLSSGNFRETIISAAAPVIDIFKRAQGFCERFGVKPEFIRVFHFEPLSLSDRVESFRGLLLSNTGRLLEVVNIASKFMRDVVSDGGPFPPVNELDPDGLWMGEILGIAFYGCCILLPTIKPFLKFVGNRKSKSDLIIRSCIFGGTEVTMLILTSQTFARIGGMYRDLVGGICICAGGIFAGWATLNAVKRFKLK